MDKHKEMQPLWRLYLGFFLPCHPECGRGGKGRDRLVTCAIYKASRKSLRQWENVLFFVFFMQLFSYSALLASVSQKIQRRPYPKQLHGFGLLPFTFLSPFHAQGHGHKVSHTVTEEDFCVQLGFVTNDQRPREATLQHSKVIKNEPAGAWKHGSVVLSTDCSFRGPGLDCLMAAHKCEQIQFQVIPHPLLTSAGTMDGRVAQTCMQAAHKIKYI